MKKGAFGILVVCGLTFCISVFAAVSMESNETSVAAAPAAKREPVNLEKEEARIKAIEKKRSELTNTQWEVTLIPKDAKAKPEQDTFYFKNDEISSENLAKRGFSSTNYTVSFPDENTPDKAIFETMQSGKEGFVFIRGMWEKDKVSGAVHEQLDGGKKIKEYYFTSGKIVPLVVESKEVDKSAASASQPVGTEKALVSKETAT